MGVLVSGDREHRLLFKLLAGYSILAEILLLETKRKNGACGQFSVTPLDTHLVILSWDILSL